MSELERVGMWQRGGRENGKGRMSELNSYTVNLIRLVVLVKIMFNILITFLVSEDNQI